MEKSKHKKLIILILLSTIILSSCSQKKDNHVSIEIWHYYNGPQKIAFDQMVMEFNESLGFEKGIYLETFSQGNIDNLETTIMDSVNKKVGSKQLPDIITAYPDLALKLDEKDLVVNLNDYLENKDINNYLDSYIEEGYLNNDDQLKIFPVAKATEIMMVNKTDWEKFSSATGARIEELQTWEGLAKTAELYYNWTDSLTESSNDGKSFFGRDAMANYIIIGAKQLGQEIFKVKDSKAVLNIDHSVFRRLWDNYYIPYVNGYYSSHGNFSSDDAKVGDIIALVGSTTGAAYFPNTVTTGDNESYNIEALMLPLPNFKNTEPLAIQQGAGMVVLKSDELQERASIEFLNWLTHTSRNIDFATSAGYLPVTKESNNLKYFRQQMEKDDESKVSKQLQMALNIAMEQIGVYDLHISKAFKNSTEVREYLTESLVNKAKVDREKILQLIDQGRTREEAVNQIATDKNFENWILQFTNDLKDIVK